MFATDGRAPLDRPVHPDQFAPFDALPGLCAIARDTRFRRVWSNSRWNTKFGAPSDDDDLVKAFGHEGSAQRIAAMQRVLTSEHGTSYQHLWDGRRYITCVWPLNPTAFGHAGVFVVHQPACLASAFNAAPAIPLIGPSRLGDLEALTARELEVFYALARGQSPREIAAELARSIKTVGHFVASIHAKLGLASRAEVVTVAASRGILGFTPTDWREIVASRPN